MMEEEISDTELSSVGLSGIEVHAAIYSDRFREACSHGELEALSSILDGLSLEDQHELIHRPTYSLGPSMFNAILAEQLETIEFLINHGYSLEEEYDIDINIPITFMDKNVSALCLACAYGDIEIVKVLLKHNADVNHVSSNASPVIYASQYNNINLVSLLLSNGADVNLLPKSFHSHTVFLPLFQACLNGHTETAKLFFEKVKDEIGIERKICYLGLLGAQCINNFEDNENGLMFWRMALSSLAELCQNDSNEVSENSNDYGMTAKLKKFYAEGSKHAAMDSNLVFTNLHIPKTVDTFNSSYSITNTSDINSPLHRIVFGDMQLCSTLEELEVLSRDEKQLMLQALLVLQDILGPSHPVTMTQMCKAAEKVKDLGDLEFACKLLLYGVESNEKCDRTEEASLYSSQLADYLIDYKYNNSLQPDDVKFLPLKYIIYAALELVVKGSIKIQKNLFPKEPNSSETSRIDHSIVNLPYNNKSIKCHSKIKLFTEMVETFMALLRFLIEILPNKNNTSNLDERENWQILSNLKRSISSLITLCHETTSPYSKFNLESEIMKIAVCGDYSAFSTLYFHQEELFPNLTVLHFLLECGASTNCVDFQGDTPLHHSIDCPKPNRDIVITLLEYGADIDICNRQGVTPYDLLLKSSKLYINPFNYLSLKCLAASAIVKYHIPYVGELPKLVESFVSNHRMPRVELVYSSKRCNF